MRDPEGAISSTGEDREPLVEGANPEGEGAPQEGFLSSMPIHTSQGVGNALGGQTRQSDHLVTRPLAAQNSDLDSERGRVLLGRGKGRAAKGGAEGGPSRLGVAGDVAASSLRVTTSEQSALPNGSAAPDGHHSRDTATAGLSRSSGHPAGVEGWKGRSTRSSEGSHACADPLKDAPRGSEGESPAFLRLTSAMKGERKRRRKRVSDPPWPDAGVVRDTPSAEAPLLLPASFGKAARDGSLSPAG